MSLLKKEVIFSKAQRLARKVEQIKSISTQTFNNLERTQREGINVLWNDPDLTPQEILDGLGADAIKVFMFHSALTDLIVGLSQVDGIVPNIKLPTNEFTIVDGKIVVGNGPYVPPV